MSDSVYRKTNNKMNFAKGGPDYQAAYAAQFNDEEQDHWADSYGNGDKDPPSRGGEHTGTLKDITLKLLLKNSP
ncbi:hypothetical protein F4806DRAFT_464162 [Annulohypoxylon nitens]|nr:hypothetical protein F4806DRAFT_464162 [Annulohypoxylon nitens]